jgi:hypothetical protein
MISARKWVSFGLTFRRCKKQKNVAEGPDSPKGDHVGSKTIAKTNL